jgi:hypothetical protein
MAARTDSGPVDAVIDGVGSLRDHITSWERSDRTERGITPRAGRRSN